jgi:signal peptidase
MRGLEWIADNVWLYRSAPLQLLTKGDNNAADDTELYARGQSFLDRKKDIVGSVLGYVTILLSEYPWLKTAMLGFMALTVVLQRE